jgi:hypothetical protein
MRGSPFNYVKFSRWSNRFHSKSEKKSARQKTLRRDADFGFIFRCRFKLQPPRAAE